MYMNKLIYVTSLEKRHRVSDTVVLTYPKNLPTTQSHSELYQNISKNTKLLIMSHRS
jgi:hypothetical protein